MIAEKLKKSILQAAIQGKLTKREPGDGTAAELLQQIAAEKTKLIKEGKIKKERPLPEIAEDEIPFDIPENWAWVRSGDIFNIRSALRIHQSDWRSNGIPFLRGRELVNLSKTGSLESDIYITEELYNRCKTKSGVPKKNDILVSAVGSIGRVYIVQGNQRFYYKDAYILCYENFGGINPYFIKHVLNSPILQNWIKQGSMATTVAQLTIVKAKSLLIPLPPLEEQKRIVARLEELLPKCDELGI